MTMAVPVAIGGHASSPPRPAEPAVAATRAILRELFGPPERRVFAVRLWDGSLEPAGAARPARFTLVVHRPGALRRMLLPPSELAVGEAYLRDDFDVEGDMEAATALADVVVGRLASAAVLARLLPRLLRLPPDDLPDGGAGLRLAGFDLRGPRRHSRERDRAAIRFHYDVSNAFFALWLDRRMVYSCGYFPTGAEDIDAAQEAKLELICRKLRLRPGERLLDMGCGWGGLVQYATERYGVEAVGVTLSEAQAGLARRRIAEAGLSDRCSVLLRDYRSLPAEPHFDKVVAVGLYEHVGRGQSAAYFERAFRLTKPGGLFLHQSGVFNVFAGWARRLLWRQGVFLQRHVWPDAEYLPASYAIRSAERAGFQLCDLEDLREHDALTLRAWLGRLEACRGEAVALVGERTYRVWRLYLATSTRGFSIGRAALVQVLFGKPDESGACRLPLTRADIYREAPLSMAEPAIS